MTSSKDIYLKVCLPQQWHVPLLQNIVKIFLQNQQKMNQKSHQLGHKALQGMC